MEANVIVIDSDSESEEKKKMRRIVKNRESARSSKLRKKMFIKDLESKCASLEEAIKQYRLATNFNKQQCQAIESENSILRAEVTQLEELYFMNQSIITNSIALQFPIQSVNTCINDGGYLNQNFSCDGIPFENISVISAGNPDFSMATPTFNSVFEDLAMLDMSEIDPLMNEEDKYLFNANNTCINGGAYLNQNFTCDGIPSENISVISAGYPDFSMATPTLDSVFEDLNMPHFSEIDKFMHNEDKYLFNANNEFLQDP